MKHFKIDSTKSWPCVLGLDISTSSIKYTVLRRTPTGTRIDGFGRYSLDSQGDDVEGKVNQFIRWLFKKNRGLRKAHIILGVDDSQMIIKKESFPSLSKKELLETVRIGIEQELGAEGNVQIACTFEQVGKDPEKQGNSLYMTVGLPEEKFVGNIQALVDHRVIPTKVMATVMAFNNLVEFIPAEHRNKTVGLLDIGAQRSMLVIFREGRMDFFREIGVGGTDITKSIIGTIFHEGKAIQFSILEAQEFKLKYGYPMGFNEGMTFKGAPFSEIGAMMRPMVERLMGEIGRSLGFYQDTSKVEGLDALYLIGGGARLKHIEEILQNKLGIPVQLLTASKGLKIHGGKQQAGVFRNHFTELAVSLALSMESSLQYNLLPASFQKIHRMHSLQRTLTYGLAAVVLLLTMVTVQMQSGISHLKEVVAEKEKVIPESENRAHMYMMLQNRIQSVQSQFSGLGTMAQQDPTLVQVLRLFSHVMPEKLTLMYLEFGSASTLSDKDKESKNKKDAKEAEKDAAAVDGAKMVRVRGMCAKPPNDIGVSLAQLIVALEKSGYFSEVNLEKEMFSEERDEYGFELNALLNK